MCFINVFTGNIQTLISPSCPGVLSRRRPTPRNTVGRRSCWRSTPLPLRCSHSLPARCAPTPALRRARRLPPGSISTASTANSEDSTPQVRERHAHTHTDTHSQTHRQKPLKKLISDLLVDLQPCLYPGKGLQVDFFFLSLLIQPTEKS